MDRIALKLPEQLQVASLRLAAFGLVMSAAPCAAESVAVALPQVPWRDTVTTYVSKLDRGVRVRVRSNADSVLEGVLLRQVVVGPYGTSQRDTFLICAGVDLSCDVAAGVGGRTLQLPVSQSASLWFYGNEGAFLGLEGFYAGAMIGITKTGDSPVFLATGLGVALASGFIGSRIRGWEHVYPCIHLCAWGHVAANGHRVPDRRGAKRTHADSAAVPRCLECAGYRLLLSLPAFVVVPAVDATLFPSEHRYSPARHPPTSIAFYTGGRVIGDTSQSGAHTESVEWSWRGNYVEARLLTVYMPSVFQYQTVCAGRVVQTTTHLAGGLTLGYQRVPRDHAQEGPELALPLIISGARARLLSEASYVFSSRQGQASYRLRGDYRLGHSPIFAGADMDLRTLRGEEPFTSGISLFLAVRHESR